MSKGSWTRGAPNRPEAQNAQAAAQETTGFPAAIIRRCIVVGSIDFIGWRRQGNDCPHPRKNISLANSCFFVEEIAFPVKAVERAGGRTGQPVVALAMTGGRGNGG
jgi:hypothetical protein